MSKQQNADTHSLAHTKWNCKYHVVFAPKYRRKVFYEGKRLEIREILRKLCAWKGVEIIEGEICPDHIHLLLSIPPKISISSFMGYLKGKSSLMIFQKYGNMKFAYRNREFWCKGYYVDTVGKNTKAIISRANANVLQKRLAEAQADQRAPAATYYVQAPVVERAAQVVEKQIREDDPALPRAAREKSDRTVVTPISKDKDGKQLPTEKQKVDVYKINLRKDHRIKAGASVVDGRALMSLGYEQGRFEAPAHFDGGRYQGATVMYNVAEW